LKSYKTFVSVAAYIILYNIINANGIAAFETLLFN